MPIVGKKKKMKEPNGTMNVMALSYIELVGM